MTRRFGGFINCPKCGHSHTNESALERWIRNDRQLDSIGSGIVRFDIDILLHRYNFSKDHKGARNVQAMMFIEAKTHGAELTPSQQGTLSALSQILRNRRANMHQDKLGRHASDHVPPATVVDPKRQTEHALYLYGGHLLRMSDVDPMQSEWMEWDNKPITADQLRSLLLFEIDPDTFRPIDWRRRSAAFAARNKKQRRLF